MKSCLTETSAGSFLSGYFSVIIYSDQKQLRKIEFILAYSSRGLEWGGRSRKLADHIFIHNRKQKKRTGSGVTLKSSESAPSDVPSFAK